MRRSGKTIIFGFLFCAVLVFIPNACTPNLDPDKWIFLGTGMLHEREDTANIPVGASIGVFSRLRFEISASLELNWVRVFFENGARWSPNEGFNASYEARQSLGRGNQEFDLPSDTGAIKRIELRVILTDFNSSAGTVKVYGLKEVN